MEPLLGFWTLRKLSHAHRVKKRPQRPQVPWRHVAGGLLHLPCLLTGQTLLVLLGIGSTPCDSNPVLYTLATDSSYTSLETSMHVLHRYTQVKGGSTQHREPNL